MARIEPDFHNGFGRTFVDEFAKTVTLGADLIGTALYDMIFGYGVGETIE
jgi:hypothetical protein